MRQAFCLLFFCFAVFARAQENPQAQMEKLMQNTTGIPYGTNKAAGKFYDIRGFQMYAETYGQGRPLLLIHGNSGSIADFVNQIPYFSKTYKVIVADSRAQGQSKDPGDSLSYEMMADDYAALLDAMKVDSALVIGWSDGGINGLLLAMRHPKKVAKLAVMGANLFADTTAIFPEVIALVKPQYTMLKGMRNASPEAKQGWKLVRLLLDEPHIAPEALRTIACPTLVIGGDGDVIKPEHTLLIARSVPSSNLWILPAAGHSTPIVYRDEFNRKVEEFFAKPYRKITGQDRFY